MHIGLIISDLRGGGAERSVLTLAGGLIDRGHRVDIVLLRAGIQYVSEIPEDARLFVMENGGDGSGEDSRDRRSRVVRLQVPPKPLDWMRVAKALHWDPLCLPGPSMTYQARAVASYMDRETPDCVLPNLSRPNAATLLACRLLDKHPPVVPVMRNFVHYDRFRTRRRHRHLAREAMHFVGVSQGVSESLARSIGVPRSNITTIYNPVVTPRLRVEMAEHPKHPWFHDGGAPIILAVGRLTVQKDYPTLIKAFAHLTARRPCRLIILGEGKKRKDLEDLVEGLHLADQVSLPGWVDNPFAFMSHASLFVLSSLHEGLPGVLVQALACGCPCVSTDCPAGPSEILRGGEFGPLVPVGDDVALADAMYRALAQPPERHVLQQRAADFSSDQAVTAYEKLISAIVRSSGGVDDARLEH